jgi:hypothetical protein
MFLKGVFGLILGYFGLNLVQDLAVFEDLCAISNGYSWLPGDGLDIVLDAGGMEKAGALVKGKSLLFEAHSQELREGYGHAVENGA